ncbi:MAG: hypothetical protein F6K36_16540 [Symploca sp. SIO3C6]|uniref:Uncharacterized protein n=1 Tax=Symploca sp. SIO1C4 TaxID=2607765 RepID=A0A6B3NQ72_9CYAN|nr:hypothetical protein [Symploca sp. SIO3C6]NER31661.1 hypothetical protein [Symploca sp. SIO1C4]NET07504.1 hypothetical protein [Symploca sp. SIO2B6]
MNNSNFAPAKISKNRIQPSLMLQALAFTCILYFCVGKTPPNIARETSQNVESGVALSAAVSHSVLLDASERFGVPTSALDISNAQSRTWSDECLELSNSKLSKCKEMLIPGWQIIVNSEDKHWVYRTNASGSIIALEPDKPKNNTK